MPRTLAQLAVLLFALCAVTAAAQTPPPLQVFLARETAEDGTPQHTLSFVDVLTGQATATATVFGDRYTIAGQDVLFYDLVNNRVALIAPDGTVRPHPFIQPSGATRRLDWVVSSDARRIAWTLTEGTNEALVTVTTVANLDGTEPRPVLQDGPRAGVRAFPVAFSADGGSLYMDYQPDALGAVTPYNEYAGLFTLSIKPPTEDDPHPPDETQNVRLLPGEPGCYCGAGFGGGQFVRLAVAESGEGFDVRVHDITAQVTTTIDSVRLPGLNQGGDLLVSPDGSTALYAMAQAQAFGSPGQVVRTVFVLVDIAGGTQRQLTQQQTLYVRPVAFTEGNDAVIMTGVNREGTWKLNLETGLLEQVAIAGYIGTLATP